MDEEQVTAALGEIVQEVAGVDPARLERPTRFADDLDIDSLTMVEIVTAAEDRFDVRVPDADIEGLATVGDAVDYILAARAAAESAQPA